MIRRYDHEILGSTVVRPLIGVDGDGHADGVVIAEPADTHGLAIGIGVNPWFGQLDPYRMAHAVVDEAIRNVVAVGADPDKIALLDNFSWGDPRRPSTLGELAEAVRGCCDASIAHSRAVRQRQGLVEQRVPRRRRGAPLGSADAGDHRHCPRPRRQSCRHARSQARRECRRADRHDCMRVRRQPLRQGPPDIASRIRFRRPTRRRRLATAGCTGPCASGRIAACHDISEGGLAVALAEMAIAGRLGLSIDTSARARPRVGAVQRIGESVRVRGGRDRCGLAGRATRRTGDRARHRRRRADVHAARRPPRSRSTRCRLPSQEHRHEPTDRRSCSPRRAPTAITTWRSRSISPAPNRASPCCRS